MIFIDTVNRIKQLPEHDDFTRFRRRRERYSDDSLTLSEAAAKVHHIVLSYESDSALTPTDSIIANMLETVLQQLDQNQIVVEALTRLAPQNDGWQVALQTPPLQSSGTEQSGYAAPSINPQHKGQAPRTFEFQIAGQGNTKICHVTFIARHLEPALLQAFNALGPVQSIDTPYNDEQLDTLPENWVFEIDQDGEPNPLEKLYDLEGTSAVRYDAAFLGLQIWFERQRDALPLLISDQRLGYIYIGNYEVTYQREEGTERPTRPLGDIDTSA
ncbi:hypothetical protein [Marinomonas ostreistagni]|uniref:hypothetical protein n=1 Tax=Marinomonas ostreistagni TaxID=359209 RepID=UPI00194ED200|nr:hypothetical protein [Marinomonas ostreistagni]MBM6551452.1 hypothetical protein [Marinomonas ostreistagni]